MENKKSLPTILESENQSLIDPFDFLELKVTAWIGKKIELLNVVLNELSDERLLLETSSDWISPSEKIILQIDVPHNNKVKKIEIEAKVMKVKFLQGEKTFKIEVLTQGKNKEKLRSIDDLIEYRQDQIIDFLKMARGR